MAASKNLTLSPGSQLADDTVRKHVAHRVIDRTNPGVEEPSSVPTELTDILDSFSTVSQVPTMEPKPKELKLLLKAAVKDAEFASAHISADPGTHHN